jgi:hypothetical protein
MENEVEVKENSPGPWSGDINISKNNPPHTPQFSWDENQQQPQKQDSN